MRDLSMCNSVSYVRYFLGICVLPQISLRNHKIDVSQNDEIALLNSFLPLISKHSTVNHHNLTLVFQNGQKEAYLNQVFRLYFQGTAPICETFLEVKGDAYWIKMVYDITNGLELPMYDIYI